MSFIPKNPLSMPEIKEAPSTPPGTRGLFAKEDGWYEVNGDGVTKKLANSSELPTKQSLGLDKVDNTPDSEKYVAHASEANFAEQTISDENGNRITETYATKEEVIDRTTSYAEVKQVNNLKPKWECEEEGIDPFYFYDGDKIVDFSVTVWCAESADDIPSWRTFTYKDVVDGNIGFGLALGIDNLGHDELLIAETLPIIISFTEEEKEAIVCPRGWIESTPSITNNGKFAIFNKDGSQEQKIFADIDIVYYQKRIPLKEKVDTVESIAKGANQAVSFANYAEMINHLESLNADVYKTGQNIMIIKLDVPDLWVSGIAESHETCIHTTEEDFVNALKGGSVQIGYYYVSQLETQKVDLTDYTHKSAFVYDEETQTLNIII